MSFSRVERGIFVRVTHMKSAGKLKSAPIGIKPLVRWVQMRIGDGDGDGDGNSTGYGPARVESVVLSNAIMRKYKLSKSLNLTGNTHTHTHTHEILAKCSIIQCARAKDPLDAAIDSLDNS